MQLACLVVSVALWALPIRLNELTWWGAIGLGSMRKRLTGRLRKPEPYDREQTAQIARRNIVWHIVMTSALLIQAIAASNYAASWRWWAGLLSAVPAVAWLIGSLVQRHKLALVTQRVAPKGRQSR